MDILIRKANENDASGIAYVNTYTWLTTYKDLLPNEVLEDRKKTMKDRIPLIKDSIKKQDNTYVAVDNNKVIGFISYGKSRNNEYLNSGEIYAIYVLDDYQGLGIGKKLFLTGIKELIDMGYNNMILNVLEGNKTINFYEKYHGIKVSTRQDNYGDNIITENVMYFDDLNKINEKFLINSLKKRS